jgi:hypothetical protein
VRSPPLRFDCDLGCYICVVFLFKPKFCIVLIVFFLRAAAGFVMKASIPSLLLVVHEVIVEGSGTAFVISVSGDSTGGGSGGSDLHLFAPVGNVYTQGYFHKYVAFASFDAEETRC